MHVLIKLVEEWKYKLDNELIVVSVLMDLSKSFDCIPHDLTIAELHANRFDEMPWFLFIPTFKTKAKCAY